MKFLMLVFVVLFGGSALFATTYYIAANGSDSNNGTSKTTPFLHAPGMPTCASACAAYQTAGVQPGDSIIFRGGDTWHFGNSAATPYTGGTWTWTWSGTSTNCDTTDYRSPSRTSCIYVGVDETWYSGSSWVRPIMTGDNPTSTSAVGSCTYGPVGSKNDFLSVHNNAFAWFDNFEWTGLCSGTASTVGNNYLNGWNLYIVDAGGSAVVVQNIYSNHYAHGWTHLAYSCTEPSGEPVGQCMSSGFITGGIMSTLGPGNVCDGWDSDPHSVQCNLGPGYIVFDNVFANQAQVVLNAYHDWHDNYWFNYTNTDDGIAHGNEWEANTDAPGCDSSGHCQPSVPFNVWYNNVEGHTTSTATGDVKVAFCPNTTAAEYWFNNKQYDQAGTGNTWDVATGGFNCSASGHEYMFNNTLDVPGAGALNCVGGMVVSGNFEIVGASTWSSGFNTGACSISNETGISHNTAVADGYMATGTGTSGSNSNTTCANDVQPCAPTSASSPTVAAAPNAQTYCNDLLASSASEIQTAGAACKNGTTDSVSYNQTTHTVTYPRQTPIARPATTNFDAGADQYQTVQVTIGATKVQLTASQRNAISQFWPDGNLGAVIVGGTNYVFAPTSGPGNVGVTIPGADMGSWSGNTTKINITGNLGYGGSSSWNQNYIGCGSVYYDPTSTYLLAVCHGEQWFGGSGSPFYGSLGLAYSTNLGVTWHMLGEVISPQAAWVNSSVNCQAEIGTGTLQVVGSYFYVYYMDTPSGCTGGTQLAVARATISSVISAAEAGTPFTSGAGTLFMKYTGSGTWTGDGVTNLAVPADGGGAFTTIIPSSGNYLEPNVRYNSYLGLYVMAYSNEFADLELRFSSDGLSWGPETTVVTGGSGGNPPTMGLYYPSMLNPNGGDPQAIGETFDLFYVYPFYNWTGGTGGSEIYSVALTVTGSTGTPGISCTPTSLTFASQSVGTSSGAQTVTCTSTATAPLPISSIVPAGDYSETNNAPATVPVGQQFTINVVFTPTSATNPRVGTISIYNGAPGSPLIINLTGTGVSSSLWNLTQPVASQVSHGTSTCTVSLGSNPATGDDVGASWFADTLSGSAPSLVSLKDSNGNSYTATPSTPYVGTSISQPLFVMGMNLLLNAPSNATATLIATFSAPVNSCTLKVRDYSLAAGYTASVDIDATSFGSSAAISGPSINPNIASELFLGQGIAAGAPSVTSVNSPFTGTIDALGGADAFDPSVSASTPLSMTLSSSGSWMSMMVALKATTGGSPPNISSLSVSSGYIGSTFNITGTNFDSSGTVTLNGQTVSGCTWSSTLLSGCIVPSGATTGSVVVTVSSVASNGVTYTVLPNIISISVSSGPVGTAVTLTGTGWLGTQGTSAVTFNGVAATPTSWSATSITVTVPAGATTGNILVTVAGHNSNAEAFTVTPFISSLSPNTGPVGTAVTIGGTTFGANCAADTVTFNGTTATPTSCNTTAISVPVSSGATTGNVVVTVATHASNGVTFTVTSPSGSPVISAVSVPGGGANGTANTVVTLTGMNFGASQDGSIVTFGGVPSTPISWSSTQIQCPVPSGVPPGLVVTANGLSINFVPLVVTVSSVQSNSETFGVITPGIGMSNMTTSNTTF